MIRFTDYGVIGNKLRVGHLGQIFPCPGPHSFPIGIGKLCGGSKKMIRTFSNGLDELYHRVKSGEDRTTPKVQLSERS